MCTSIFIHSLSGYLKRIGQAFALLGIFMFSINIAHAQYVHTNGTQIVDGEGNPIYFTGMNLGNWLLWEGYLMMGDFNYRTHTQFLNSLATAFGGNLEQAKEFEHQWRLNYVTEQAVIDLKNLGFNSVRVPFHYNMFWENGQLSNHGFQYFDRLIEWCSTHEIYILLDMHAAPGYQNPGDHSDNLDSDASQPRDSVGFWDGNNVQIASQVWRHIANRYANEPIIWGYDLINEPVLEAGREYELLPSMIEMRNAIREVDTNHMIVAEGGWWASQLQFLDWTNLETQAATGISSKWDDNLVYETHHYVFGNVGLLEELYARDDITNNLNIPLILGEYGEDTNNVIRQMTDWSLSNIAGHFPWSFKKMSHDRTLWTIQPNNAYNQVKNAINSNGTAPAGSYNAMINFAQNNVANGSAGITWHQGFYDAVKSDGGTTTPDPSCDDAIFTPINTRIEAENYCDMNGVQTETTSDTGGGLNVGHLDVGDWIDFNINVPSAGTYTLTYRVASAATTGAVQFLSQNSTLATSVIPNTGGWQTWTEVSTAVVLSGGQQTVRLFISGAQFNINWFEFAEGDQTGGGDSYEDAPFFSTESRIEAENYCAMLGVQTETTSDTNGGLNVGWLDAGDWMDYRVNIPTTDNYTVTYRVAANGDGGQLEMRMDMQTLSSTPFTNTGGWQSWTNVSDIVTLPAGEHVIRLYVSSTPFNLNAFTLSAEGDGTIDGEIENGIYTFVNFGSGKALDVSGWSTTNGGNIQLWSASGGANQQWQVTSLGNGQYRIDSVHSGLSLDVSGVSTSNGANIHQWTYGGGTNQHWFIENIDANLFRIISVHSGKSLDVQDESAADGANIQQWDYHGGINQLWLLQ